MQSSLRRLGLFVGPSATPSNLNGGIASDRAGSVRYRITGVKSGSTSHQSGNGSFSPISRFWAALADDQGCRRSHKLRNRLLAPPNPNPAARGTRLQTALQVLQVPPCHCPNDLKPHPKPAANEPDLLQSLKRDLKRNPPPQPASGVAAGFVTSLSCLPCTTPTNTNQPHTHIQTTNTPTKYQNHAHDPSIPMSPRRVTIIG